MKLNRKSVVGASLAALLVQAAPVLWANPFDEFRTRVQDQLLKPFAKDLGGLLGAGDFHSGRALGVPGFDVQATAGLQFRPGKENSIFRDAGVKEFGLPRLQVEVGLPLNIDAIGRGLSAYGTNMVGGGLRYGLWKTKILGVLPDIAVSAFGDSLTHDLFKISHFSFNLAASLNLPIAKPYLGFGLDSTKVTVKDVGNTAVNGASATATGTRLTAGVDLTLIPFTHIYGAYTLFNGNSGAEAGLGVRF